MKHDFATLESQIEDLFAHREKLSEPANVALVESIITHLDAGRIRVSEPSGAMWKVNVWIKKAILLYFAVRGMKHSEAGPFVYHDKIPLKTKEELAGVRAVPGAIVRKGAHLESGVILMPSFVNIGAYVGSGTMVDTWATVGSCAQVGRNVHLSGGVGVGGVLEPPQAAPVIIGDGAFLGSRCIVVEGVHVGDGAVLGANVVLTASTKILDVSGPRIHEHTAYVPPRSVVIPGTRMKKFPAGEFGVPCALIIGQRKASTDEKTSLNDALRDFNVEV